MYYLEFKNSLTKDFRKIPKVQQQKIWDNIQQLKIEPRPKNCRKMAGTESDYRIRIGDYRVVYRILDDDKIVIIFAADHRKDIYR
jgi:mRNA interferase RelE/StbE